MTDTPDKTLDARGGEPRSHEMGDAPDAITNLRAENAALREKLATAEALISGKGTMTVDFSEPQKMRALRRQLAEMTASNMKHKRELDGLNEALTKAQNERDAADARGRDAGLERAADLVAQCLWGQHWRLHSELVDPDDIAAAIRAMKGGAVPASVGIKPLEWQGRDGYWRARSANGCTYEISEISGQFHMTHVVNGCGSTFVPYPSIEDAKAAAQADFEAKVRACLIGGAV